MLEATKTAKPIVEYNVSDAAIETLRAKFAGLTAATPAGYKLVTAAIGEVRSLRVAVEKKRKELKADALEFGRKVDSEAKRITAALESVEEPLKIEKAKIDDEKARIEAERVADERRKIEAEEARVRAEREAAEAAERERIRLEQQAENDRLAAERARLAEERAALEAERKAIAEKAAADAKAAQEKIDADRRELEKQRQEAERARFEREAEERAERDARAKVEREAAERAAAAERQREEQTRLAALRPDVEKLNAYVDALLAVPTPGLFEPEAIAILDSASAGLDAIADTVLAFTKSKSIKETALA